VGVCLSAQSDYGTICFSCRSSFAQNLLATADCFFLCVASNSIFIGTGPIAGRLPMRVYRPLTSLSHVTEEINVLLAIPYRLLVLTEGVADIPVSYSPLWSGFLQGGELIRDSRFHVHPSGYFGNLHGFPVTSLRQLNL